ncbi:alpha/beta fold hydrolase [Alloscardovia venturai]|uniref:Alpha/beta fold hydrolase n=1 Tax=Alloscardovia venturai TaxID=1769421 RepID=A0ABW2Y2X6_9BIFI
MVQLDERAAAYGVTFLDDSSDEVYFTGMKGVHALLDAFTSDGWFEPASPRDAQLNFEKFTAAPTPVVAENGDKLHYVHINAKLPDAGTQSIVMITGFTEMAEHMEEMSYYFWQAGFDVWILEHRGHGRSPRDVNDMGMIWIDDYRRYVADAEKLIRDVVRPHAATSFGKDASVYVYAHSMGGGVATLMAEHTPGLVNKYVLSAPMIAPIAGMPDWVARLATGFLGTVAGKTKIPVSINQKEFNTQFNEEGARGLNHSRALWLHTQRLAAKTNQMYVASNRWAQQAMKMTDDILEPRHVKRISDPMLLIQSENDKWVRTDKQDEFVALAKDEGAPVTKIVMKGARHELESEKPEILHGMVDDILDFLA